MFRSALLPLCLASLMNALPVMAEPMAHSVGRLEIVEDDICTAVILSPQIVLSAAHCVFERAGSTPVKAYRLKLFPSEADGQGSEAQPVFGRQLVLDRDYRQNPFATETAIANDLALILLERKLEPPEDATEFQIKPLKVGDRAQTLVPRSDGQGFANLACPVVARNTSLVVVECDLPLGASGAPLFFEADGGWYLGAIVSSVGMRQGRRIALGVDLQASLGPLLDEMAEAIGKAGEDDSSRKTVSEQLGREESGVSEAELPQVLGD